MAHFRGKLNSYDLNPIRAKIAKTPEGSDYTSIQARIKQTKNKEKATSTLLDMTGDNAQSTGLQLYLKDYLELVDWTVFLHPAKPAYITSM